MLAGALLGAILGSFIATLTQRWGAGRAISGRSACDHCGETLRWFELVPLLSFAALRGRCARCATPIAPRQPLIEALAALIGAVAFARFAPFEALAVALFGWQLLALALLDLEHFWLPDRLTALLGLSGLIAGAAGFGPDLLARLIGATGGFASLWLIGFLYQKLRRREGLGGGDPKIFGAIGLWLGWQPLALVLFGACLIGLGGVLLARLGGKSVSASDRLPLGSLLAIAAFGAALVVPV